MATKFATGLAKGENTVEVAKQAVKEAKSKLGAGKVDLVICYCSTRYNYQEAVKAVREATAGAPLIGCSTGGEFTEEKVEKGSIAVGLISSDSMKFFPAMAEGLKENELATIKKLTQQVPNKVEGYPYLFGILLVDGLAGKGEEATVITSNLLGVEVTLAGGAAADDLKFKQTFVFYNDKVVTNAAVLCLGASKSPVVTSVMHGHVPLSEPLKITKAKGGVLYEVNGRPAWEVWKEKAAEDARTVGINVEGLKDATSIGSFLLRYELGIPIEDGEYKVRIPLSKNDDGSLNFACTIPQGIEARIMKSIKEDQIASAREAMVLAEKNAGGNKIAGALIFDCVCRGLILGTDFFKAVEQFKKILGNVPLLGWETYGEICMRAGEFSGFHNTTSVILLLPAK